MGPLLLFWISALLLIYIYAGVPVLARLLARLRRRPIDKGDIRPTVSLVVCAFNEERHIEKKIDNCRALDYPAGRIEWIVISDGSTDRTNQILQDIADPRLRILTPPVRQGKTACQNLAATVARNEILFFTDATTIHPPDALRILLRSLNDTTVGCVTGRPLFRDDPGAASQGLRARERYEFSLRRDLSDIGTLFGAQDCMYAIPRSRYAPVREDQDGGFVGPLMLLARGLRTVYEPDAIAFVDRPVPGAIGEMARRSRMILGGLRGLLHMAVLLNPLRHGLRALALISTRLLRWLTPVYLATLLVTNTMLLPRPFYTLCFAAQLAFYLSAALACLLEALGLKAWRILSIPRFFTTVSLAAAWAILRLLGGATGHLWETRR